MLLLLAGLTWLAAVGLYVALLIVGTVLDAAGKLPVDRRTTWVRRLVWLPLRPLHTIGMVVQGILELAP